MYLERKASPHPAGAKDEPGSTAMAAMKEE